ncbi:hypothetical protein KAI32_04565 [Candidatus Pacearchaeota archaeon]|nr:hypothetical protein [Candidatus Pacearchaeota archaeon]
MNNSGFYNWLTVKDLDAFAKKTFGEMPLSDFEEISKLIKKQSRILEVGCGTGRLGLEFLRMGFNYMGVEKQEKYIDVFRERGCPEKKLDMGLSKK